MLLETILEIENAYKSCKLQQNKKTHKINFLFLFSGFFFITQDMSEDTSMSALSSWCPVDKGWTVKMKTTSGILLDTYLMEVLINLRLYEFSGQELSKKKNKKKTFPSHTGNSLTSVGYLIRNLAGWKCKVILQQQPQALHWVHNMLKYMKTNISLKAR